MIDVYIQYPNRIHSVDEWGWIRGLWYVHASRHFLELIPESTSARDDQTPSSLDVDKGLDADGFLQLFNQTKKWYGYLSDYMVSVAGYP